MTRRSKRQRCLTITRETFRHIMATVGTIPPESGGILGADPDGVLSTFFFDAGGKTAWDCYIPDPVTLTHVVNEVWQDLTLAGIVHSHQKQSPPSPADVRAARALMEANDLDAFLLPIVAEGSLTCYLVQKQGEPTKLQYKII